MGPTNFFVRGVEIINLLEMVISLEDDDNLHIGRLLILISDFSGKKLKNDIKGMTQLAKLDFFLRYPVYLERAMEIQRIENVELKISDFERRCVESRMVRYRFGPWDFKYRRLMNIMYSKGLIELTMEGRSVRIKVTSAGKEIAEKLSMDISYQDIALRSDILKKNFNMGGTKLKNFIYDHFSEIVTLEWGEHIEYEF